MTEISSFSASSESNRPASDAGVGRVNSLDDVNMPADRVVNPGGNSVNPIPADGQGFTYDGDLFTVSGTTTPEHQNQTGGAVRLFDTALAMQKAGINVVPVKQDGSKTPDLPRWKKYESQRTTGDQIFAWFGSDQATGIGCIYGKISGNVEMLEFEGRAVEEGILDEVTELMETSGFGDAWKAITTGWVGRSPSGGLHFRFRVEGAPVKGNTKLASRPAEDHELTADQQEIRTRKPDKIFPLTLVETRGEGGFGVCEPSHGKVHPSGRPYERVSGGPESIPVIDAETYEAIHDICHAVDRIPKPEAPQWRGRPVKVAEGELRPGDDYNERGDVLDLLKAHGWTFTHQRGETQYWCRPGKQRGIGASFNYRGCGKLYVFTSSTEFDNERAYTPFAAYAVLEHGGNFKEAARALASQGYGTPMTASADRAPVDTGAYDPWTTEQLDDQGHVIRGGGTPEPVKGSDPLETEHVQRVGADDDSPGIYSSPEAPMRVARELEPSWIQGSSRTLHHWRDQWMQWTGTHWREVGASALRSKLYLKLEHGIFYAPNRKGEMEPKPWNPSVKKISALVDAIAAVTHLDEMIDPGEWLGPHKGGPRLISCANTMLNPLTGETMPHTPAYFVQTAVPYAYDPAATCPQWLDFLDKVFPGDTEAQQLLQEWMGYVLSGWTHYQKGMQLIGPPRAGKGTIARIIEKLIGTENSVGATLKSLITNFGLAPLLGKTLCVVGDAQMENRNSSEVVARLLSITGEDSLPVDRKNRAIWSGKLPARMMILANKAPRFSDSSGAITGRFLTLHFTQSFAGREDKTLEDRLTTELAGILNWALEGLRRLDERGHFVQPESAQGIIESQKEEGAPHQAFVEDRCVVVPGQWIKKEDLYWLWNTWCESQGIKFPGTSAAFAAEMYAAVPGVGKTRKRVNGELIHVYTGITAKVEPGMKVTLTQSDPR